MAVSKRTKNKPYQRVQKFPQARGKIIADVELAVSSDYFLVEIKFQDKTALMFDLEPCVTVTPKLVSWKTGDYKPVRQWLPAHSRSSRI
jgi:hypothetical protein